MGGSFHEGDTDEAYFNALIPRLMEDLVMRGAKLANIPTLPAMRLKRAGPGDVAKAACAASDSFVLVFSHADTGGRSLEQAIEQRSGADCEAMRARCDWPPGRCIVIAPRHETEAWALADAAAVTKTSGYAGMPASVGLPATAVEAERLADPKATLRQAVAQVRGRRRPIDSAQGLPAMAQSQALAELRASTWFRRVEDPVRAALADIGRP